MASCQENQLGPQPKLCLEILTEVGVLPLFHKFKNELLFKFVLLILCGVSASHLDYLIIISE